MAETTDIPIVGGGIVGMATALELQMRDSSARIAVLEKEPVPAAHQSGRNSGAIRAAGIARRSSRCLQASREIRLLASRVLQLRVFRPDAACGSATRTTRRNPESGSAQTEFVLANSAIRR